MKRFLYSIMMLFSLANLLFAQEIRWQRNKNVNLDLELFHSTHTINLPTGETLQRGDFEFEISHRFIPPIKDGYDAFWGLDGPANIRFALAYAPSNHVLFSLGRTNVLNNLDFQVRYKAIQIKNSLLPSIISLNFGAAWNKEVTSDSRRFQYFAQLIYNTMINRKIGIALIPSYLNNSALTTDETKYSFTMGTILQYYFIRAWSVLIEWNPTVTGWRDRYNSVAAGIELETGGHFFKLFVTNNSLINMPQFLAGADKKFSDGDLRLGFMITRLL